MTTDNETITSLLNAYPPPSDDHYSQDAADSELRDLREWSQTAKTALETMQLDAAQMGRTLSLAEEVETLRQERNFHQKRADHLESEINHFVDQRDKEVVGIEERAELRVKSALKDAAFFKEEAERAVYNARTLERVKSEVMTSIGLVQEATRELADRYAQIEALEVDVAMLEEHVEALDAELAALCDVDDEGFGWLGWDAGDP
jgi:chromosome segregation ATPase